VVQEERDHGASTAQRADVAQVLAIQGHDVIEALQVRPLEHPGAMIAAESIPDQDSARAVVGWPRARRT